MKTSDQGTRGSRRHHVIPRTLVFLTSAHPDTGVREVLLLRGAPSKRLWANRYNGLGGHVEANEDVLSAARREVQEEAGVDAVDELTLRGILHIDTGDSPGVVVFVFHGEMQQRDVVATDEGQPEWINVARLAEYPLVDDLYELLPRVLEGDAMIYGQYTPGADDTLRYQFTENSTADERR